MAIGFKRAWKNGNSFDWRKVLNFFKNYISHKKFITNQLQLSNYRWQVDANWVTGSIADLLTEGMYSDKNAFDISLTSIAKEILVIIIPRLKPMDAFDLAKMGYSIASMNTTAGKSIMALTNYSLRRARHLKINENPHRWETEIRSLLDLILEKEIIEGYFFIGYYFNQFYYLDKKWITTKIKEYSQFEDKKWMAIFSGLVSGNHPFNKDNYLLFYPYYERAINKGIQLNNLENNNLASHIATFFF